jgi:hypothetical protein
MDLLVWIAERETDDPGGWLNGTLLMQETSGLAGDDGLPWEAVAKAAARLRKRGYLAWDYDLWPNESRDPPPECIDQQNFQRAQNITVSGAGFQALAAREAKTASTQVNIVNSTVGQVALGDIRNIDLFVILDAAERALEQTHPPKRRRRCAVSFAACATLACPRSLRRPARYWPPRFDNRSAFRSAL